MIRIKLFGTGPIASLDLQLGMVGRWWVGWRRSTSVVLQRLRAAAGGCSGEWRWRGRVGDGWRSVGRYRANRGAGQGDACACAHSNDVDILTKYRHHNQHMKQQRKRVMSHDYFEPRLGLHQARHYRLATVRGTPLQACDCSPSCTSITCLSVFVFVFG